MTIQQQKTYLLVIVVLLAQSAFAQSAKAQSWGQLKSQALEAQAAKKYDDAVEMWNKALAACENSSGPRYVQSMSGLAQTYAEQGKSSDADACFKKVLDLSQEGSLSDDGKAALINYAAFLRAQKRGAEAANLETKFALQAKPAAEAAPKLDSTASAATEQKAQTEKLMTQWHASIDSGTKELAQKHFPQAEQAYKQALALADNQAKDNRLSAESLKRLIQLYSEQEKPALADPLYKRYLAITRVMSGGESKEYAQALKAHGLILRKLNRKPEAMSEEGIADRILAKSTTQSGASNDSTASMQTNNTSGSHRGSLLQRANSVQSGYNDATNQALNGSE